MIYNFQDPPSLSFWSSLATGDVTLVGGQPQSQNLLELANSVFLDMSCFTIVYSCERSQLIFIVINKN